MNALGRDLIEGETLYCDGEKFVVEGGFGTRCSARGTAVFGKFAGRDRLERVDGMDLSELPGKTQDNL